MIHSMGNYIKSTDKLVGEPKFTMGKTGFELDLTIQRAGKNYDFHTEAITAGGYNIQRLHYRYIPKTKLPKLDKNIAEMTMKKDNDIEELNGSIQHYEELIQKIKDQVKEYSKYTVKSPELSKANVKGSTPAERIKEVEKYVKRGHLTDINKFQKEIDLILKKKQVIIDKYELLTK